MTRTDDRDGIKAPEMLKDWSGDPGPASAWLLIQANRRRFDDPVPSPRRVAEQVRALEAALAVSQAEIAALRASTSWRLTSVLRWLMQKAQSRPPKLTSQPPPPPTSPAQVNPPQDYAAWISLEEPRYRNWHNRPERGRRPVRQQQLGLVLLGRADMQPDPALLASCPSSCKILLLSEPLSFAAGMTLHCQIQQDQLPANATGSQIIAIATAKLDVDLLCFLDVRDQLAPDALAQVSDALARQPQLDVIFADEDWLDADGQRTRPFFKPCWDTELQRGRDLAGPFTFLRAGLVRATDLSGSAWQFDLTSQVAAMTRRERIHRIPAVLCHRLAPPPDYTARQAVIAMELKRQGLTALAAPVAGHSDWQRIVYDVPDPAPLVSIIIPTRDHAELLRACVDSILHHTDYQSFELIIVDNNSTEADALALLETLMNDTRFHVLRQPGPFNWSALNNIAAAQACGEILLLLNNDIVVHHPGWLAEMVSYAIQPGIGAVGAKLLYPDGRVQHAGMTTDQNETPRHLLRFAAGDTAGPFGLLGLTREVWGVTGACLAIRRQVFFGFDGLSEAFPLGCNDVDLCLRLRAAGYRIIWTPWAVLEHCESASRGVNTTPEQHARAREEFDRLVRDWGSLAVDDPYLHPALDAADEQMLFSNSPENLQASSSLNRGDELH